MLFFCSQIRLWNFDLLSCSSCSLSASLLGCLSLLLTVCCFGWLFFPKLGQLTFYYFLRVLQRFRMHFSFLSGAPHFLLFSIICRALSCATRFHLISKQFVSLPVKSCFPCLKSGPPGGSLSRWPDLLPQTISLFTSPPHTSAAPVLGSNLCSFSHPCFQWLVAGFF